MPTFSFHFPSRPDLESISEDLEGPDAAREEAALLAGQLMKDQAVDFWHSPDRCLYVTDETGDVVCTIRMIGTTGDIQKT